MREPPQASLASKLAGGWAIFYSAAISRLLRPLFWTIWAVTLLLEKLAIPGFQKLTAGQGQAAPWRDFVTMRTLASSAKIRIGDINLKFRRTSSLEAWRFATLEIKERDTVAWLNHHANREKTGLIDVGANIGIYTLFWCAMGGDRSHAIEPLPQNLIALRRNLELNDFEKHVTVWSCAASDQNGWLDLWVPSEMPGEGMASSKKQHGTPIKVVAAQIDDLVSERDLNFVVKIDVEGAELDVLRGMHAVLSEGLVVSVLVERNENFPEVEAFLSECGMFRNTSYTGRNAVFDLLG